MLKKVILFFVFIVLQILLLPTSSFASTNFSTDYNVTYTISENASTRVNIAVSLANKTEQYYASSYSIQVGFKNLKNLKASDSEGQITPTIIPAGKGSNIELKFNQRVVGLNNKLNFNLSFDTDEIAHNLGQVREVNIPGLSSQNDFSSFNVTINYPQSFGKPSYTKPYIPRVIGNKEGLTFSKNELGTAGISIAFGEYQVYEFNLTYHLKNSNLFPVKTEIALPPSTNYQDVLIDMMSPRPENVRIDKDGNWLASYILSSSQKLNVVVKGKSKIYLNPREEILTDDLRSEYLKEKPYWQTSNSNIKILAKELDNPYAIYKYVVSNLEYDFSRVTNNKPRAGATGVLSDPSSAVCLEFTDLFIAIARAAGIPAREVNGFAYTKNPEERPLSLVEDILHAWPEYYDNQKKAWIMVDPTWGNTTGGVDYFNTLDFDHFAFVIKGLNSSYPIPAGGYKTAEDNKLKDVLVTLSDSFDIINPKLEVEIDKGAKTFSGIEPEITFKAINMGNIISKEQELSIDTQFLFPKKQNVFIGKIPPFGYLAKTIAFEKTSLLTNRDDNITITSADNVFYKRIQILPFFLNIRLLGGVSSAGIIIILSVIAFRSGRIPFFRRRG